MQLVAVSPKSVFFVLAQEDAEFAAGALDGELLVLRARDLNDQLRLLAQVDGAHLLLALRERRVRVDHVAHGGAVDLSPRADDGLDGHVVLVRFRVDAALVG